MPLKSDRLQAVFLLRDKPIVSFDPKKLKDHPLSEELFGELPSDEYGALKSDIQERGIQDALHIAKQNGNYIVVNGHQRKKIAIELGIEVPCIIRDDLKEEWQIEEQLIKDNLLRRQLSDYQKVNVGLKLEEIEKTKAGERQKATFPEKGDKGFKSSNVKQNFASHYDKNQEKNGAFDDEEKVKDREIIPVKKGRTGDIVAKEVGFGSGEQYRKAKKVYKEAPKEIKKQWQDGKISTHTAYLRTAKHTRKQQREQKKKEENNEKTVINSYDDIKNMDCIDFLNGIKDNSIDLILTDPPYEISRETGFIKMSENGVDRLGVSMDFGKWDKNVKNLDIVIGEFYRILKPNGTLIIFYDLWKITKLAKMLSDAKFKQLRFIEWIKTNPVPLNSKINYLTNVREIALTAVKKGNPTFNSEYDNGLYSHPIFQNGERFHPTQKPTALFEELIKKHSNKNDLVLDCFLGSGTTAIAARNTERRFAGCEIDAKYYNLIIKRLNNGKENRK